MSLECQIKGTTCTCSVHFMVKPCECHAPKDNYITRGFGVRNETKKSYKHHNLVLAAVDVQVKIQNIQKNRTKTNSSVHNQYLENKVHVTQSKIFSHRQSFATY